MVSTRAKPKGSSDTPVAAGIGGGPDDRSRGSIPWFRDDQGLNATGLIPGTGLLEEHVSREEYVAFWGPKTYTNGTRYKTKVSRRMVRRIRFLYQRVFQRPIGKADAIPYHFGRGLLAERKGLPVDWASYARKMTHRGTGDVAHLGGEIGTGAPLCRRGKTFVFETMDELRERTDPGSWPRNEVGPESECEEEGREDDWPVNVIVKDREASFTGRLRSRRGRAGQGSRVGTGGATTETGVFGKHPLPKTVDALVNVFGSCCAGLTTIR